MEEREILSSIKMHSVLGTEEGHWSGLRESQSCALPLLTASFQSGSEAPSNRRASGGIDKSAQQKVPQPAHESPVSARSKRGFF